MKLSHYTKMFLTYLGVTAADFASSLGSWPEGFHEANPFARHTDGSFWPAHALVNCGINTLEILVITLALYYGVQILSKRLAEFLAGLPWLYYGYGHWEAAINNVMAKWPGLYVPNTDSFKHIFGSLLR